MFATISSRFNTLLLMLLVLMAAAMIAILARGSSAGPLDPPSAPASTLPQVEPRSPIPPVGWNGASAISINSPGSYFLTRNLTAIGITIAADNVTLDLNGFTLFGGGQANGIVANGSKRNITIRNGSLAAWTSYAIYLDATRSTLADLDVSGSFVGVYLNSGNSISHLRSHNNTNDGLDMLLAGEEGGSITDSDFSRNGRDGLSLGNNTTVRNTVIDNNTGCGLYVNGSRNDIADSRMVGNVLDGYCVFGNRNVMIHNHIDDNPGGAGFDNGAGNMIAPISPVTGANPAENYGFP